MLRYRTRSAAAMIDERRGVKLSHWHRPEACAFRQVMHRAAVPCAAAHCADATIIERLGDAAQIPRLSGL
jgi:hypothetical protein